jgi:hypothetical protein
MGREAFRTFVRDEAARYACPRCAVREALERDRKAAAEAAAAAAANLVRWAACDACGAWRVLPGGAPEPSGRWTCADRPGTTCASPPDPGAGDAAAPEPALECVAFLAAAAEPALECAPVVRTVTYPEPR